MTDPVSGQAAGPPGPAAGARPALGGILLLVVLWFVWGTSWPAMRIVFIELPVWQFRAVTCGVAGLALLLLGMVQGPGRWKVPRAAWPRLIVCAFLNMTCWHVLVGFGLGLIGAGHAAIVCYTLPVWTALLAGLFFGERITARVFFALLLGMAGVAVLLSSDFESLGTEPLGFAFVLGAAVTWGGGTLVFKNHAWDTDMSALAGWQLLIGLAPIAVIALLTEDFVLHKASNQAVLAGLYVLVIGLIAGYALWFRVVSRMPATIASIGALMIPVIGVGSAAIMLGEPFGLREGLALVLVLSAIALVIFFGGSAGRARVKKRGRSEDRPQSR